LPLLLKAGATAAMSLLLRWLPAALAPAVVAAAALTAWRVLLLLLLLLLLEGTAAPSASNKGIRRSRR